MRDQTRPNIGFVLCDNTGWGDGSTPTPRIDGTCRDRRDRQIGDRTQLLSLALAAQFRKPMPIIAGIFFATIANHAVAGFDWCVAEQISNSHRA
jgi:hypothetical protein